MNKESSDQNEALVQTLDQMAVDGQKWNAAQLDKLGKLLDMFNSAVGDGSHARLQDISQRVDSNDLQWVWSYDPQKILDDIKKVSSSTPSKETMEKREFEENGLPPKENEGEVDKPEQPLKASAHGKASSSTDKID